MNHVTAEEVEFQALSIEYRAYIDTLKAGWVSQNRVHSKDVYPIMRAEKLAEVHQRIAAWGRYITPFAEAWWSERGYDVVWPDNTSQPMQVRKLADA